MKEFFSFHGGECKQTDAASQIWLHSAHNVEQLCPNFSDLAEKR
jgi:hypothetical protein